MRILLVTHYYPAHRGGIEAVAGELARRLAVRHEVEWFASACDEPPPAEGRLVLRPVRAANAIERRLGLPFPLWDPRAIPALRRSCRNADVVHLHDVLYMGNLAALLMAKAQRKPVLVTQHVGFIPYRNPALRGLLALSHRSVAALALGRADRVVFVSNVVRDYFRHRVRLPPHDVIPNGVDLETFRPASEEERRAIRSRLGVAPHRPLLLFVGRFVEKKGLPLLRLLAEEIREPQWVFAGWGPLDPGSWNLPHVKVLRERRGKGIADLYQAADLLLLPSVGEGFPLVVQEAMSCGTPAVVGTETAGALPGLETLLYHEHVGRSDSVSAWCRLVRQLLDRPAELSKARGLVAAHAHESWSWDRCAAAYEESLLELATRARPHRSADRVR